MHIPITNGDVALVDHWAALDLGSNSFHLLLVKRAGASFAVVERLKERVQLLGGFSEGRIQQDAQQRGLNCLARFAQRLQSVPPDRVSVMGTCALRQADNAAEFLRLAESRLPGPIEIISGQQEAQLIYLAVAHHLGAPQRARLVIDIGGGSTEMAWSGAYQAADKPAGTVSIDIGCVYFKDRFFRCGISQADAYLAAREVARQNLLLGLGNFDLAGGSDPLQAIGTSGTIESVLTVLRAHGWCSDQITAQGLAQLEGSIVEGTTLIDVGLPGLAPDRIDIFPAGVAILSACFEVLQIQQLDYVDVTLLQGMICSNLARSGGFRTVVDDLAEDSLRQLAAKFSVDQGQANRVSRCVQGLFRDAGAALGLDQSDAVLLRRAAQVHEVGAHVNARHYHRHGGYIIKHTELPGFTEAEQSMLALLVRGHRRSLPGLAFQAFDPQQAQRLLRIVILLRLAAILERSHDDAHSPTAQLIASGTVLQLRCGPAWLDGHPLSRKELEVEARQLQTAGFELQVSD